MEEKRINRCLSCNKRAKAACTNRLCYTCCSKKPKKICALHKEELARKTDEERYIQEGLDISNSSKKKKRVFIHAESNFSDFKQTVVIWCLKDFCQNKGMSASTFTQIERVKSSNALKRKRNSGGQSRAVKEVDDMTRLQRSVESNNRKRNVKFHKLKKLWQKAVEEQESRNDSTLWLIEKVSN